MKIVRNKCDGRTYRLKRLVQLTNRPDPPVYFLSEDEKDHNPNPSGRERTNCTIFLGFTSNLISSGVSPETAHGKLMAAHLHLMSSLFLGWIFVLAPDKRVWLGRDASFGYED